MNNNYDLILAQIIELNVKGYISIEYKEQGINKYNYTIKQNIDAKSNEIDKIEMIVLSFLFSNKMEITKRELEEKFVNVFSRYNMQYNELKEILNKDVIEEDIIDNRKNINVKRVKNIYLKMLIVIGIVITFSGLAKIIDMPIFYIILFILEQITIYAIIMKANAYTDKGKILKYNIDKYKIKISDKEYLRNNASMEQITKSKEFANSIALHINSDAKRAFIDNIAYNEAIKESKKAGVSVFAISTILLIILVIFASITVSISKEAAIWGFIILVVIVACSADIVFSIGRKK